MSCKFTNSVKRQFSPTSISWKAVWWSKPGNSHETCGCSSNRWGSWRQSWERREGSQSPSLCSTHAVAWTTSEAGGARRPRRSRLQRAPVSRTHRTSPRCTAAASLHNAWNTLICYGFVQSTVQYFTIYNNALGFRFDFLLNCLFKNAPLLCVLPVLVLKYFLASWRSIIRLN